MVGSFSAVKCEIYFDIVIVRLLLHGGLAIATWFEEMTYNV